MHYRRKKAAKKASSTGNFYSRLARKRGGAPLDDTYEKGLVFVGMAFHRKDGMRVFNVIKQTCSKLKLRAKRIDDYKTSGFIILEVVRLIERSEFLIFDLTRERPNVYYELGYAHGIGNAPSNIILLAKEGTNLHFDVGQMRVHRYKSANHLVKVLSGVLKALIKER